MRGYVQTLFLRNLTQQQKDFNEAINKVRVSVEWFFGEIIKQFKFTDFKKNQRMGLSPIAKQYRLSVLPTNSFICLYRNNASKCFDLQLSILEAYFANENI